MAQMQQYTAPDFQGATSEIVQTPTSNVGNILMDAGLRSMNRAKEKMKKEAFAEGLKDELGNTTGKRVQATEGWNFTREQYDSGASYGLMIRKQGDLATKYSELVERHKYDQTKFEAEFDALEAGLTDGLEPDDIGQMEAKFAGLKAQGVTAISGNVIDRNRQADQTAILGRSSSLLTDLGVVIEQTGQLSEAQAIEIKNHRQRMVDAGFTPQAIAAFDQDVLDMQHSQFALHEYKNTQGLSARQALVNDIAVGNGEWGQFDSGTRRKMLTNINIAEQQDNASRTAANSILSAQLTDAIALTKKGFPPEKLGELIQAGYDSGDPDIVAKAQDLMINTAVTEDNQQLKYADTGDLIEMRNKVQAQLKEKGGDEYTVAMLDKLNTMIADRQTEQKNGDGLGGAIKDGLVVDEGMNPNVPGQLLDPDGRMLNVQKARAYRGDANVGFYTADEMAGFTDRLTNGTSEEKKQTLATIKEQTPAAELDRVMRQVASKSPEYGVVTSLFGVTGDQASAAQAIGSQVIDGMEKMKNNAASFENKANMEVYVRKQFATMFQDDLTGTALEQLTQATMGLIAANEGKDGSKITASASTAETYASKLLMTDKFAEMNDAKIMPPLPGVKADEVEKFVSALGSEAIGDELLRSAGGGNLPVDVAGMGEMEITANDIGEKGRLVYIGPGQYVIAMPTAGEENSWTFLQDRKTGKPFTLDWQQLNSQYDMDTQKKRSEEEMKNMMVPTDVSYTIGNLDNMQTAYLSNVLGRRESDNNYQAENRLGYIGRYQFGAAALVDAGLIDADKYAAAKAAGQRNKEIINNASNWVNPQGKSSFLRDPKLQEKVFQNHTQANYQRLVDLGIIDDSTTAQDVAGYLYVAHLLGTTGAVEFAGGVNGEDANGTQASEYFKLGQQSIGKVAA